MTKVLRLGFVLGGGVSLGSFSAAALSESLKQQILFAQYAVQEGGQRVYKRYDVVEVDVFSGASAGAMSLAVMLRTLVNSRDKFRFLGFESYERMRERMEQQLLIQFGEEAYKLKQANSPKWESLVAVQIMQQVQARLWTDEVNIDKLLGVGGSFKKLDDVGSFLDRSVVDDLARRCFQFGQLGDRVAHRAHVLGQRVLFACTLANLSYTQQSPTASAALAATTKAGDTGAKSRFAAALNDAASDKVHSEVRVFDFSFVPISAEQARYYPLKWVQYHQGEDLIVEQQDAHGRSYGKMIRNLDKNEVWREVAATAVASGAFPLAFEPVVLNRYQHEYGEDWSAELRHLTKYPFTYVDGGVFNNEPIGEALRLAAFLDSAPDARRVDFDRQIIFIDPNVANSERQLASSVHNKLSINRSLLSKKSSVASKSALMRMATKVPHLLAAILNEARTPDAVNIVQIGERFAWRDNQRTILRQLYPLAPNANGALTLSDEQIIEQRRSVVQQLDHLRAQLDFPSNTLQIQHELLRIAYEERTQLASVFSWSEGDAPLLESLNRFVYSPTPSAEQHAAAWLRTLAMLALDISLQLIGKRQSVELVPIAPFDFYRNDYRLLQLPGGGLAGFAGFASAQASAYEVAYGQYCANRMLSEMQLIAPSAPLLPLPTAFDYNLFDSQLRRNLQSALHKRIKELLPSSGIASTALAFLDGFVQDQIHNFVEEYLLPQHSRRRFELRIRVGKELFSLRGFNADGSENSRNTLDAVRVDSHYYLLTQLNYDADAKTWTGGNIEPHSQRLYIDKVGLFSNSAALSLSPPIVTEEMMRSPNPIFILDASVETAWGTQAHLANDRWFFYSEAAPLDEALWGDDKLRQLAEKM